MQEKLKWGILGTGNIAKVLARALVPSTTGELIAVGSRTQESADKFAGEFSLSRAYGSYEALLEDTEVQAVYISLPNHLHLEWATRCAERGKHILCEKPLTTNRTEAEAMIEAVRQHDAFMMEAFMYRCHPQTARLAELIRNQEIGEVRVIQAHFSYNMGLKLDNIRLQNEAAGGAIMDVGCYTASMARLVAGAALGQEVAEPEEVKGVAHIGPESRVDEWATAVLRFPNDILANLTCGSQVSVDSTLRIWGSKGHILVPNPWFPGNDGSPGKIIIQRSGQEQPEEISVPADAPLYTLEADIVAQHLAQHQAPSPCMTWNDSLGNMQTLDRWREQVGLVFDRER
ncbi:MAG: Gfo/Idh/MocA family oxidoreductase [Abitibacteriaceae bacterium]|nr:Gfo/Idh/MocA family oxidoreductase [Abditibacteriaceae bacterium]